MVQLTVTSEYGIKAGSLNSPHKDPFDRMLAGQTLLEHLTMATADRAFTGMGVKIIW
jgi:PIN domain nuclease of toxin-antitoxin system